MHRLLFLLLSLTVCIVIGCDNQTPSSDGGNSPPTLDLLARLETAGAIQDNSLRDAALADLAKDAAKAGEGTVTKGAIDAIGSNDLHDTAGAEAAILLTKVGKFADASVVAKLIRDNSIRDQTLATVARDD